MEAVLGSLVGGVLAIAGGLLVALATVRHDRRRWQRDAELKAATDLLSALQSLVRRLMNLAYLEDKRGDEAAAAMADYREATIAWNSAMYAVLLVGSPASTALVPDLDREVDRLWERAMARRWTRAEFREERKALGQLAARYLATNRTLSGHDGIALRSLWTWDESPAAVTDR
ncbi:hypothetical protein [Micromonospora sp. S4605]|uniref:hypothetical protein n=1 Tax=Micromonospora sp. S4605 TaxID=1420897 RepID=UPI0011B4362B|nr:hypothetical protein [Micromonospora sp. S4605]